MLTLPKILLIYLLKNLLNNMNIVTLMNQIKNLLSGADHTINYKFSIFKFLLKVFVSYEMDIKDFSCVLKSLNCIT